ncbi:Xaa-Pro aminopeptidase [Halanaerobium sp. DL-01]|uniref:M24 family metallopeptidase n=1 Tax=Halanaerobium sp. DL-01 TaxID=1653064 RepID=UPI000DF2836C|nr:Xaa-Pro peptidase family protein [Halanaerobium sp. DL-01]RCW86018.1 Xaa-Pro aminopeptidase [Halanaerobium sp. DL-01]
MEKRINKLRSKMKEKEIEAFFITSRKNVRYLTGFTGTAGRLLITKNDNIFITDSRYTEQAEAQTEACRIEVINSRVVEGIGKLLKKSDVDELAFESEHTTYSEFQEYREKFPIGKLIPQKNIVEKLRTIKEASEVELIKKAVEISDRAFFHILNFIRPGITEKEVSLELEFSMKKGGGEANAFDFIVASGKRGALPHGVAADKKLEVGDLITMDFGTVYRGYHSDITRTVALGEPDEKLKEIYDLVFTAQKKVIEEIKAGMTAVEADSIARDFIKNSGYGDNFGHGLGHGVGLQIHEAPRLSYSSNDVLKEGMIVTDEPGIYVSGLGGVRIEDDLLIKEDGCQVLNSAPKELIIL